MKCCTHQDREAISICKSCGKGLCQECNVDVQKISYCKECVNNRLTLQNKGDSQYDSLFGPAAEADRDLKSGGDGLLGLGIVSIFLVIFFEIVSNYFESGSGIGIGIVALFFIMILAMVISISVACVGFKALKTGYGNNIGIAARILGYISAAFLLLFLLFFIFGSVSIGESSVAGFNKGLSTFFDITFLFFGVTQIVWGIAQIESRLHLGKTALAVASGIMMILSGCITALAILLPTEAIGPGLLFVFSSGVVPGLAMLTVSSILSSVLFMTAKKPDPNN